MNIEYVLNDNTVFEEHQKEIRPVLMEVLSATKASSSFISTPSIDMCIKMEHTLYLINIAFSLSTPVHPDQIFVKRMDSLKIENF